MQYLSEINDTWEPSKPNIETLAQLLSEQALDGVVDPVKMAVQLTAIEQICEAAKAKIREAVVSRLEQDGGKATSLGAAVQKKEVGVKWDYSNSPAWLAAKAKATAASERLREIEKIAQTLPEGQVLPFADPETGEVLDVSRGAKSSTTSFIVTLSKKEALETFSKDKG